MVDMARISRLGAALQIGEKYADVTLPCIFYFKAGL